MMERPAAMSFAAGAYVFPGGRVDAVDADPATGWHGPSPAEFGVVLGASPDVARALVCAAVRETFEEAGVLLAGTPESVAVPSGPDWEADRTALTSGSATLGDLLARRGLVLRADLLIPWARWITPAAEPKRFDARFFTALLPSGQEAVRHEAEAERIVWLRPEDAIESARAGSMMLLPPTATTLNEFAALGDVAAILRQRRTITPIQPRITVLDGGQAWVEIPGDVPYPL
jgi:8-oxo-dGTP pyrophosphatase MutT (NUDIX family)